MRLPRTTTRNLVVVVVLATGLMVAFGVMWWILAGLLG